VSGFLWTALGVVGGLGMTAFGDMVSEEVRDRLDHLPHAILRLAAKRLDPGQRATMYDDEWMPELTYILTGDEARPVTRLYHGTHFALGILMSIGRITRQLRPTPEQSMSQPVTFGNRAFSILILFLPPTKREALIPEALKQALGELKLGRETSPPRQA
jgi:hypothetical protein